MGELFPQIAQYVNGIIYACVNYYAFTCIFKPRVKRLWIVLSYIVFVIITSMIFLIFENPYLNLAVNLAANLSLALLFAGNKSTRTIFAGFLFALGIPSDVLASLILNFSYHIQNESEATIAQLFILGRTISNIIHFAFIIVLIICFRKYVNPMGKIVSFKIPLRYTLTVLVMLLGIVATNALYVSVSIDLMHMYTNHILAAQLAASCVMLLIIWHYNTMLNHLEEFERSRHKDQMLERFELQYQSAINSQQAISKLQHNLKNHFLTLLSFTDEGDESRIRKYITNEVGKFDSIITTGNIAIDAMLNYYLMAADERLGIEIETELFIPPDMELDAPLISMILGNALENAADACEKVEKSKRYISFKALYINHCELIIIITNPYVVGPVLDDYGNLMTIKADKKRHGLGLVGIHEILPEDVGNVHVEFEDGIFRFILHFFKVSTKDMSNSPDKQPFTVNK